MYVNYLSHPKPPTLPDILSQSKVICILRRKRQREFCYVFLPSELAPK
uniref:LD02060p n=1 Tax=Drosophila melanogaster TaxID=7227 RepID=Q95RY0_DROME|nr:LD02060p [Drosophila melanogaster]